MSSHHDSESRLEELLAVLKRFQGKRLFVAVLGSPDPDGLSSAWALTLLARHAGVSMDILTFETLSRPDNALFCRLLGIPFRRVAERLPRARYAGYAVVDRQNTRLPVPTPSALTLVAHLDHHVVHRSKALFAHQDPSCGSTATIVTGYVAPFFQTWTSEDPEIVRRLATALMYGIRTDTQDFLTAVAQDFRAASFLAPYASAEWLRTLLRTPLGPGFLTSLTSALGTLEIHQGLALAFAGRVPRRARDSIGQVADFLLQAQGVQVVVVFGLVDGFIVGSLRTVSPDLRPHEFLEKALSKYFGSAADCGGRAHSGGFQIPIGNVTEKEIRELVCSALRQAWSAPRKRK